MKLSGHFIGQSARRGDNIRLRRGWSQHEAELGDSQLRNGWAEVVVDGGYGFFFPDVLVLKTNSLRWSWSASTDRSTSALSSPPSPRALACGVSLPGAPEEGHPRKRGPTGSRHPTGDRSSHGQLEQIWSQRPPITSGWSTNDVWRISPARPPSVGRNAPGDPGASAGGRGGKIRIFFD